MSHDVRHQGSTNGALVALSTHRRNNRADKGVDSVRKTYGNPRHRTGYDQLKAAISDAKLAHTEVVAGLEWFEREMLDVGLDRLHLAYRFLGEVLMRAGRVERPVVDDQNEDNNGT
jgi:hypothetical protein